MVPSLQKFDKSELSAVIFGLNTSEEHKIEIFELIVNAEYKDVAFKEAKFVHDDFVVKYEPYIYKSNSAYL